MKKLINEWRKYLLSESEIPADINNLITQINNKNGAVTLNNNQKDLLIRYVRENEKSDPLSAAFVAGGLYVYYRDKINRGDSSANNMSIYYRKKMNDLRGSQDYTQGSTIRAADEFLGVTNTPSIEKEMYAGTGGSPVFAKLMDNMSSWVKSQTGITILDPSRPKTPPNWARKSPYLYTALQGAGELLADDPFTLVSWFLPAGGAGKAAKGTNIASKALSAAEKRVLPQAFEKAAQVASTKGEQAAVKVFTEESRALPTVFIEEAKKEALAIVDNMPANIKKDAAAATVLKAELDKGVLNAQTLFDTLRKENPNVTREQVMELFQQFEKFKDMSKVLSPTEAVMEYQRLQGTYAKLIERYGIGVDLKQVMGGYITKVGEGRPEWLKYVYEMAERTGSKEIMAATEINIGTVVGQAEKKGSSLFRRLFHEIGHTEFLKNYRQVAKPFYTEWSALARRQVYGRQKQLVNFVNSKFGTNYTFENLGDRKIYRYIMTNLSENEAKWFSNNYTVTNKIQELTNKFISSFEDKINNPDGLKQLFSEMDVMYRQVQDEIAELLPKKAGRDVGNLYFLIQPEEVFAELFEKTARGVVGGQTEIVSKNFPETIKMMQQYAEKAAKGAGMIREGKIKKKILYLF